MEDTQPTNVLEPQIEAMIRQLGSKNAAKRREAAYFLGEAAAEEAVPELVEVYRKDKNASVRAAAAYSLGMYKAVEQALRRGEEEEVVELLHQIADEGKLGSRAPVGRTVRTLLALVLSLIVLGVAYSFSGDIKGLVFGSTNSRSAVVGNVRQAFNLVNSDTRTLQTELLNVISNQPLGCIAYFNNPSPYHLDPADARTFSDIASVVDEINAAQANLTEAKAQYDAACNEGAAFDAQQTFQLLRPAIEALAPIDFELLAFEQVQPTQAQPPTSAPVPTEPQAEVQPTSAEAATPTASGLQGNVQLQPTIPPEQLVGANPKSHLAALFNIIDNVTDPRGASALLVQYWTDVQNSGSTTGCDTMPPTVPSDDVFIPDIDFQASPNLREGVQLINSGLSALRDGWLNFQTACNSNTMNQLDVLNRNLANAQVAASAFDAAEIKLEAVRNAP